MSDLCFDLERDHTRIKPYKKFPIVFAYRSAASCTITIKIFPFYKLSHMMKGHIAIQPINKYIIAKSRIRPSSGNPLRICFRSFLLSILSRKLDSKRIKPNGVKLNPSLSSASSPKSPSPRREGDFENYIQVCPARLLFVNHLREDHTLILHISL